MCQPHSVDLTPPIWQNVSFYLSWILSWTCIEDFILILFRIEIVQYLSDFFPVFHVHLKTILTWFILYCNLVIFFSDEEIIGYGWTPTKHVSVIVTLPENCWFSIPLCSWCLAFGPWKMHYLNKGDYYLSIISACSPFSIHNKLESWTCVVLIDFIWWTGMLKNWLKLKLNRLIFLPLFFCFLAPQSQSQFSYVCFTWSPFYSLRSWKRFTQEAFYVKGLVLVVWFLILCSVSVWWVPRFCLVLCRIPKMLYTL